MLRTGILQLWLPEQLGKRLQPKESCKWESTSRISNRTKRTTETTPVSITTVGDQE